MKRKIFSEVYEGFCDLFRKPELLVAGAVLWGVIFLVSTFGGTIGAMFRTTFSNIVWVAIFTAVLLSIGSFIFSGMIGILGKKKFFKSGLKFWKKNLIIILVILIVSTIIGRVAHHGAFFVGKILDLSPNVALGFFLLIYLIGLEGILIFLTYSSFFLVFENCGILKSLKKSKDFVLKNYFETFVILILFFAIDFGIGKIGGGIGIFVEYVLFFPFVVSVLGRMVSKR